MAIEFQIAGSKKIKDLKIITPSEFRESRGSIWTSYNNQDVGALLPQHMSFVHDKFSISKKHVLRGIHGDHKTWKLVSCVAGQILQVVVDMRENSESFLHWEAFDLGGDNRQMILLPPGFGNAFYVKSDQATYHYKLAYEGHYTDADEQFTVRWDDPRIKINWPTEEPILSDRDGRL